MARRSPRARRKGSAAKRIPAKRRAATAPGRGRNARAKKATKRHPAGKRRAGTKPGRPTGVSGARRKSAAVVRRKSAGAQRQATRAAKPARRKPTARARRFAPPAPARVANVLEILERLFPDVTTALDHKSPLQLLIATILSAQCTDKRVNMVTPGLFERYPDAAALAGAKIEEMESIIRSTGFFRSKTRAIRECCADIVAKHRGQVPNTIEELTALRGVGRKTANVVLGNAFGIPGLVVDTHVGRLSMRLGLTNQTDAVKIEYALMPLVPREKWTRFSHWLILHGRSTCIARKPRCSICALAPHCPRIAVTVSE